MSIGVAPVSAIVPVKNAERHMAGAIDSVISQVPPPAEVIVVNGRSTDGSAEVARSYEAVTLIEQRGDGLAGAWNQAVEASTQPLIAFLDSDDVWLPGKIEAQLALLDERPDLAGATGLATFVLGPGVTALPPGVRAEWLDGAHPAPMPGTLMVRREVFDQVGHFDPDYLLALDVDWFARVKDAGLVFETVDLLMLEKRFDGTNLSTSDPDVYHREMLRAMRASAARQQGRAGG